MPYQNHHPVNPTKYPKATPENMEAMTQVSVDLAVSILQHFRGEDNELTKLAVAVVAHYADWQNIDLAARYCWLIQRVTGSNQAQPKALTTYTLRVKQFYEPEKEYPLNGTEEEALTQYEVARAGLMLGGGGYIQLFENPFDPPIKGERVGYPREAIDPNL